MDYCSRCPLSFNVLIIKIEDLLWAINYKILCQKQSQNCIERWDVSRINHRGNETGRGKGLCFNSLSLLHLLSLSCYACTHVGSTLRYYVTLYHTNILIIQISIWFKTKYIKKQEILMKPLKNKGSRTCIELIQTHCI